MLLLDRICFANYWKRDGVKEVTFPKIHICLNSAHSASKLRSFYPEIDETLLKKFYGVSGMAMTKELWNKLVISKLASKMGQAWKNTEHINLTEFYEKTRPKYIMAHCMLEYIDCRSLWDVRSKSFRRSLLNLFWPNNSVMKMGSCLEFDSRRVIEQYKSKMQATMTKGQLPPIRYNSI